jgi:hypothetical protein
LLEARRVVYLAGLEARRVVWSAELETRGFVDHRARNGIALGGGTVVAAESAHRGVGLGGLAIEALVHRGWVCRRFGWIAVDSLKHGAGVLGIVSTFLGESGSKKGEAAESDE